MKTTIIYWSSTGNTKAMATLIEQGLRSSSNDLVIKQVADSTTLDIEESDILLLGCSAMGVEEIDTSEMEPFIKKNERAFMDKKVALFGSYGWGDGEWMDDWEKMMDDIGAQLAKESLKINELPEGDSEQECIDFGKAIGDLTRV